MGVFVPVPVKNQCHMMDLTDSLPACQKLSDVRTNAIKTTQQVPPPPQCQSTTVKTKRSDVLWYVPVLPQVIVDQEPNVWFFQELHKLKLVSVCTKDNKLPATS